MKEKSVKSAGWFFFNILIGQIMYGILFAIVLSFLWGSFSLKVIAPKIEEKYAVKSTSTFSQEISFENRLKILSEEQKINDMATNIIGIIVLFTALFISSKSALRAGILKIQDANKIVMYWLIIPVVFLVIRIINGTGLVNTIINIIFLSLIAFWLRFLLLKHAEA